MTTCDRCGRPTWTPTGGMGGHLKPHTETHCLKRGASWCRAARAGYLAGLREGVEIAKEEAIPECYGDVCKLWIDWEYVDMAIEVLTKEGGSDAE